MNPSRLLFRLMLGRRLPVTRGTLSVPGLRGPLRIRRDRWGIPHVDAGHELDAFYGAGFCHGQDRAFQLEALLRVVRGTLAELVGPPGLPVDRLSRRVGFHHAAKEQLAALDADVREMLEAYARGVNAGTTLGSPRRAHEFVLLRGRPTPWTPADSLAVLKLISFTLASNWDVELARLKVLTADGPEALRALDPAYPPGQPVTDPPGAAAGPAADRLADDLAAFTAVVGKGGASNNWAVAGARTATGRPLLANDPHLNANLPPHWYLAHLRCPDWEVAGATFLGGPSVLAGHNGHAAWGVTAGLVDNTDLFRERVGPDGASVREGDRFVPCPVREEVIAVRGDAAVTERVLVTPRGPVVSPAFSDPPGAADGAREVLSLRATWLDPRPVRGLLVLHRVRSFAEFRAALAVWPGTSQNVVYADAGGTVGWQLMGEAPRRRKGWGTLPLPGWEPGVGWEPDPVPASDMPHLVDPDGGFVATANNAPCPAGAGPYLGSDWMDGYREASIHRSLASRADWDVASTLALQTDRRALSWEEMRDAVLAAPGADADARRALELLRGWDGVASAGSTAAAVFELFVAEMACRVGRAKAPNAFPTAVGRGDGPLYGYNFFAFRRVGHLARLLREQPPGWFARPWPEEVADALAGVVRGLRSSRGPDERRWGWGSVRPLTLTHPLGAGRWLARVFNLGPVSWGGDADTINQASVRPLDPLGQPDSIASMRVVIDVGAWGDSRFVLPAGQSGNPLSPHYDDLFPLWQRGEGVPIAWTPEEVRAATRDTLELVPG